MTRKLYPIIHKCRECKKEFEYLDKIVIHVEDEHKFKL